MSGNDVDIDIVDNGDGTVSLLYTPRVPDAYTINIKFGGQPVPKGKFTQQVSALCLILHIHIIYNLPITPDRLKQARYG